ncbi:MAG: PAS-domain containing protein [Alphaproteobacteria bacterium]|nr:PAS-domain containing protein [Alphaproteobacteria bacterium]
MSTGTFLLIIAAVAGASAVFGFALCRAGTMRNLRRERGAHQRLASILATVPGGFISWDEGGTAEISDGLRDMLGGEESGVEDVLNSFGTSDAQDLERLIDALRTRGEEFSRTLLTIDAGQALRIDGRRSRHADLDVVWVADVTNETAVQSDTAIQLTAAEVERDGFRAMLDALPIMVWRRSRDLSLAQVNRAYVEALHPEGDHGDERRPSELEDVRFLADTEIAERARSSGVPQSESRHVVIGGSRRLLEFSEVPTDDMGVVGYARDFTQLEEVQEELSSHVAAQSDVLESLAVAVAIYGSDTRLKFYNSAYARLWDADAAWLDTEPTLGDELEKLRERRLVTEEVDFRAHKQEQLSLFTSLIAPTETLVHLPDGKTLFKRISPHPLGGLMFTYEDVTDRLSLEGRYNTMIEVQRRTLDNLYEGVALIGPDGRLKLCNSAYGRLWQFSEADLAGEPRVEDLIEKARHFYGDMPDEEWKEERKQIRARLMSREPVSGPLERADGTVLQYAGVPLPDGMMLMTYFDVTDSNRVERALRERNEALEEADRLKSEFVANVSYELRTPLNTIIGFAEVLNGDMFGPLNERQSEYIGGILEASEALLELINDILDLATIEAGYMTLDRVQFDIHAMMAGVFSLNRERARVKEQKLVLDCAPDIGSMFADERRLKQVLFNLASNAIKFTPEQGVIRLGAERDGDDVIFSVTDTGVGIHADEQERVLESFERGNRPRGRQSGVGAGLGLSLVKSFVELHGGEVELSSEPDEGTAIRCRMPSLPRSESDTEAVS